MLSFTHSLPMMLYRTLDGVMPHYRELFGRHDLTEQQWRVLRVVWRNEKVTSAILSEKTLLTPPSLVGIVDRLENKQLVTRVRSRDDRRQIFIVATPKGRALQNKVQPQLEEVQSRIRESISDKEWADLEKILNKIANHSNGIPQSQINPTKSSQPKSASETA